MDTKTTTPTTNETAPVVPVDNTFEELQEAIDTMSAQELNESYHLTICRKITRTLLKKVHGGTANINLITDKKTVSSVITFNSSKKQLNQDMYFYKVDNIACWVDCNNNFITLANVHSAIKKTVEANKNIIYVFTGDVIPKNVKMGPKNENLKSTKTPICCHTYDDSKQKYTFIGKLELVKSEVIDVKVIDQTVNLDIFYFALPVEK
jgi:hypothetical protein